ncbi:MAG: hypothetical protein JWR19_2790 [Pedosphaera sp.]|nr:hypothetical protein [Pedosphaera sp.]
MKIRNVIALAGAAVLFSACIPSVNPFYTEKDVVFDPRLTGEWQTQEKNKTPEVWKFENVTNTCYHLTITDKDGKQGEFEAHLLKLKQEHFLDIIPADCKYATNQADLVAASMFPGHLLLRVPQLAPELKLAFFDFDWLEKYLKANPQALAHRHEDKSILLTAGTRDLQRFVLKHLGKDELFKEPEDFARNTNAIPGTVPPQ